MTNLPIPPPDGDDPPLYAIRLHGHLDERWTEWFDGMTVTRQAHGDTLVVGPVVDQAALHGLLRKIRDIGLPLLAVTCLTDQDDVDAEPQISTQRTTNHSTTNHKDDQGEQK